MKNTLACCKLIFILLLICSVSGVYGQLSGVKKIPGAYPSISSAVADLNTSGVGAGGVIFDVAAGYLETLTSTISLTATGTAANPIIFRKDPATAGTHPLIRAYTPGLYTPASSTQDGIWRMIGSDYVTIDGIDLEENPANTSNPSTMEYGYALYKASTSNGCQYVTITNCVISLSNINNDAGLAPMVDGSTGIIVMNATATAATIVLTPVAGGTNSYNKFYGNTIQQSNNGIALIGYYVTSLPSVLGDSFNEVGGNTALTGNSILNYGGGLSAINPAAAIRTSAQYNFTASFNTINNNNGSGSNHPAVLRGIYLNTALGASATVSNNTVTLHGGGTIENIAAIENLSGVSPSSNTITISNNTITNGTYASATTGGFTGILNNNANPQTLIIRQNTITNNSSSGATTGFFYGIHNSGVASTVNIDSNLVSGNSSASSTFTGNHIGIYNTAAAPVLNITANTVAANVISGLTGVYYAIANSGVATSAININANNIGTLNLPAVTFLNGSSVSHLFINNSKGGTSAILSISNNNFHTVAYTQPGTGANTYISNIAATKSQLINNNTFTNMDVNTAGAITFIANSVAVPTSGTQNVNSNSIAGSFIKSGAGASLTLFSSSATSVSGSSINNSNNNFTNIAVFGATTISGWVNTDAGASNKFIQDNIFGNWTGGTGAITAMSVNITGITNATSGNVIENITSAGAITGILTSAGNDNIYLNTISALSTTGASAVTGISATSGTKKDIYRNKVFNLQASNVAGTVAGISVSGNSIVKANIYNNLVSDLRAPITSSLTAIAGISATSSKTGSAINIFYNTVYLNAVSSGTIFGTSGIYHASSATSTIAALDLRNNIIVNTSTPNTTGLTVAFRKSSNAYANYATTSNNNLFYAGPAGVNRLLFYDGTNPDQTLGAFKARVTPREVLSVTEDLAPKFLSTVGSSPDFLHLDPSKTTQAESGAVNITNYTIDYDTQIRQGNAGYAGTGTGPDIGADEFAGTPVSSLQSTYNVGVGETFTSLTNAGGLFASINSLGLTGNLVVNITSDLTEDGTNSLYQWTEQGTGNYTVTIQTNSSSVKLVSGNILGPLIRLSGVKRLIIDGSNGTGTNYLTFRNTNPGGTGASSLTLLNGTSTTLVRYCNFEANTTATTGVILFGTSTLTGGNSNNTITNCRINATVNSLTGSVCVYSAGTSTAGFANTGNIITNNSLFNYRDRALEITATGSTAWVISGNSLFNGDVSGSIDYAASSTLHGIRILGGSGYSILNNFVGGNAAGASGTAAVYSSTTGLLTYQGILLTTVSATPASNIKGNTIANLSIAAVPVATGTAVSSLFFGIETNGSGINIGGSPGEGNTIGSNTVNGSILLTTTTTVAAKSSIRGIYCNSTGGIVTGNQVGGIDIRNLGNTTGPSTFFGIYLSAAGAPTQMSNNIVGSTGVGATANSIRVLPGSVSTTTSLTGIGIASSVTSAVQVTGNVVENVSYQKTVASGVLTGITNNAASSSITITGNTMRANTMNASTGTLYGIYNSAATASLSISNNLITGNLTSATTGTLQGVYINSSSVPASASITGNTFSSNTNSTSSGAMTGIANVAAVPNMTITGNTFNGNVISSTTGQFYAINSSGAVTTSLNINSNEIGTSVSPAITYTVANSTAQIFLAISGATGASSISISNNNFYNILYSITGSGSSTYLSNSANALNQSINSNVFFNLNLKTSGSVILISNNAVVPATGTQNVNNNSISGTFTKTVAGGTVTFFTASSTSLAGAIISNNDNKFSNVSVTGGTAITGFVATDPGTSTRTIQNNTFTNWAGGTSTVTAMSINLSSTTSSARNNVINNINGAAAVIGISTGIGNDNLISNTINTLSTSGTSVTGIAVTAGTSKNILKNKIYDLSSSSATGMVNGILVSSGLAVNIVNNLIGDLRAPSGSSTTDLIRGISITSALAGSTINIYYNTIYLNAVSSGANFYTAGVYHLASSTSTVAVLNLRNNSITNTSTPKGTLGTSVALRRSTATLANYASTSNNNLLYAGAPGQGRLIYADGTALDQTLADFKNRVKPRDTLSVSEDLTSKYITTSGPSPLFLHMNTAIANALESAAANVDGYTDDFDGQLRAGTPGYTGAFIFPDIGADEITGIENVAPTITYTLLDNTTATTNRIVTGVSISDISGVNNNPGNRPRIYYKRFTDGNVWLDNTPGSTGWKYTESVSASSPYSFTIDYSLLKGGAAGTAGIIQYFIVAQDLATIGNVGINSGTFAAAPTSVALVSAAFPVSGTINSYKIPFSGSFRVGTNEVFTSLTRADGLFASIDSVGLAGSTTFNITTDITEDGTHPLDQWVEFGGGNYSLTIKPDADALRTISGDVAAGLIRFNGADRVSINGSNSSTETYLGFKNLNTSGTGSAFSFTNGSSNNSLNYLNIDATSTNGVIFFGASAVAGGNSNNLVDNCTIVASVGPVIGDVGIYSTGTTGNENTSNIISNNTISGYRNRGLDISATGSSAWMIADNSFFNGNISGGINYPGSSSLHGIRILGGSGYSILNNSIGGSSALATGANAVYSSSLGNVSYQGILLNTTNALPLSEIKRNTISGITISSVPTAANSLAFTGVSTTGSGINIGGNSPEEGNLIGSASVNGSISVSTSTTSVLFTTNINGISTVSTGGIVNNNQVGGFDITNNGSVAAHSFFQGIFVNGVTASTQVNHNVVGSASTPNSIRVLPGSISAAVTLRGINIGSTVNSSVQVSGNRVENIANLSTFASGNITGIDNMATLGGANITISTDTIQYLSSAANANNNAALFSGIRSSSAATINDNLVSRISLSSTGTIAQVIGIYVTGGYSTMVSGNTVENLTTSSRKESANPATESPTSSAIIGLLNSTTSAGQIIKNNRFTGLTATSVNAINVTVTGMGISSTGSGSIFNNRFGMMTNTTTGSAPAIIHIKASDGSFNVYNNTLRISNLAYTNGVHIFGIVHASLTSWNYFHNTVRASGHSIGTALRSAAFILSVNSSPVLRNNILFNIRTGTGSHHAVSNLSVPPSTWISTASDYNDLYTIDPATVGEWGNGANVTFNQWKTVSGGDVHSISNAISFIQSPYDLQPDSITNCNFNKAGTPITTPVLINRDIDSTLRNPSAPDLGAYEFNYTGFTIIGESNSPICSGDSIHLTVNPGEALVPSYIWRDSTSQVISILQNPVIGQLPGLYTITVTDSTGCSVTDSVRVTENQRPSARITSTLSVCDSGNVLINIAVTGTGTITGTLSNGDEFSGTAPLIVVSVFLNTTASISITALSDSVCTSLPSDIPDTLRIAVTHKGDWLGINSNWNDPVNWCGGIVPTSATDVVIPAGTNVMPVITDTAYVKDLLISAGDSLTISSTGTLMIAGSLTNNGIFTDKGTTHFNGTTGQQTFAGVPAFNNLIVDNTIGLRLPAAVFIRRNLTIRKGIFATNNNNISIAGNWVNNASVSAFTAGSSTVTFIDSALQLIAGNFATTFRHLEILKTVNPLALGINTNINGNLAISGGTFDLAAFSANRVTSGGTITISNNTTLKIGGTGTFPANYTTVNLGLASTVDYSGTDQNVARQAYGNLALSSSTGGTVVKTLPGTSLTVSGNLSSTATGGGPLYFNASSPISVAGQVLIGSGTVFSGGSFVHTISGNWTNNGTYSGNTGTVIFNRSGALVSGTGAQNFNHLTVAAAGVLFSGDTLKLTGNFATTGSGTLEQAAGGTLVMSGNATTISGTGISLGNLVINGTVSTSVDLAIASNLAVSGSFTASNGTVTLTGTSKTFSGSGSMNFFYLSITGVYTSLSDFTITSGLVVDGSFVASAGTATFTGSSTLSGNANLYDVNLNGTSLKLSAGSILGIANNFTITGGTLDVAASRPNTVNYNGARAQNILAISYSNLVLSNGNIKTAVGPLGTLNDITIAVGTSFDPGTFTHNIYGNWVNNGSFIPGTSTIQFSGPMTAYITGQTTFNILNSNSSNATTQLILLNNVSASIVNMISGNINTGTNTLTITDTRTGEGFILGKITRNHVFTSGIAYAFEGPQNTITFSTVSGVNSVTVFVEKGSVADFPFGGSIGRIYDVLVPAGTYNATLKLHYEDDELNGNVESSMGLWHNAGAAWVPVGKTGNNTTLNYVEQSGLTDINNRWTLSDNNNLVRWNGSLSSDWNTAGNWTVLQGSGSRPPSPSDIVDLGSATFLNQPVISDSVRVKNIVFGSTKEVTLTLAAGGSLTTLGDISGDWKTNATHTINVNDQALTVNGNINLSDSTTGHAINLNIAAGTVTTMGSLSQTGGASIIFTGSGILNIHQDFNYSGGIFTAGSSTVVYNGDENQHVARIDYNNLSIIKDGGVALIDAPVNISGDLAINSGALEIFSGTTIGGNVIIDTAGSLRNFDSLFVSGNWVNTGDYLSTGATTIFEGTGSQTISPTTFHDLTINKPSGTAELTGQVVATGDFKVLSGIFDFKTFDITRQVAGGTAVIANGAFAIIGGNNGPVNFTTKAIGLTSTIIYNGTSLQYISSTGIAFGNVIFRNGGANPKVLITSAEIKGNLTIEEGASLNGSAFSIKLEGNWLNLGTFVPSTSTVLLNGISKTITGITTFYQATIQGTYTALDDVSFNNTLTVLSSSSFSAGSGRTITVHGDFQNFGTWYINGNSVFSGNVLQTINSVNATIYVLNQYYNGSVSPLIKSTSSPRFTNLYINNTGGVSPLVGWTVLDSMSVGVGGIFNGGMSRHTFEGSLTNNGTITSTGFLVFQPANAATINFGSSFSSTTKVTLGGSGHMTLSGIPTSLFNLDITNTNPAGITPGAGWNISNNFTVVDGSLFNAGTYTFLVGRNISNRGTINSESSTFTLNGAADQDIYNISPFNNLTINKSGGVAVLSFNATVNGVLNFVSKNIQTGVNVLIQPASGSITNAGQATGWVNGRYQKFIPTGAASKNFEVGDATRYTPVSLVFSNVSVAGNLIASSIQGDHPNLATSQINRQKSVNRYWSLTNNGVVFNYFNGVYNFATADVDAGANTEAFKVAEFNGSSWSLPASSQPNPTNIRANTVTAVGSFAAGELCNVGTTISYPGSPFCTSSGIILPTRNGTAGGAYTSTSGLSINSTTGAINLGSSNAGTYKITYTLAATSECAAFTTFVNVTVTTQPFANGVYNGNPYCVNGGIIYPTGTQRGAFGKLTSTAGLSLDSLTGAVNLGLSTPGTYTITYTVLPSGGCAFYSTTTTIVIKAIPSATISYPGTPYCSSAGIVTVTQTGSAGGIYSSAPGLILDSLTGSINTQESIPGAYTVHYTIAASGCAAYTTVYDVEITALPSASIVYSGSPFCNIPGTASPTITGTTGGSFHSTPGLMIDSATGVITLGTSTAGDYVVSYFMPAAEGCASATTTTPVTISVSPSATIAYVGTPFINTGTVAVTRTGTGGGVYSSSEGLLINPATGLVNLANSALGVYEVLYTIHAGGCEPFEARTSITIYSLPVVNSGFSPDLKSAANFVLFTISGAVGNTGASLVSGNIGTNIGAITGFGATPVACARHSADALTSQVAQDLTAVYHQLDTIQPTAVHDAVLGHGETLYAGVYSIAAAGSVASVLNLDAQGNPDAVFIFKIGGAFTTGLSSAINLLNGATSCNVFWKAEGAISLAASTQMKGTLIANGAVSIAPGSILDGRLLSISGPVTIEAVTANIPGCFRRITSWTGATGTDWNNACNWLYAEVPTGTTHVTIPSALVNYPVLNSGIGSIDTLVMENSSTLTVSNAILQIAGNILSAGTINANNGSIEFNGSTEQAIHAATFSAAGVKNLTVNNNAGVTLGGPLSIIDVLTIAQGNLVTNGYLTLKSGATGTARVARITSSGLIPIDGNVTVERFIPGRRKYRLITSSVTTSVADVLTAGQENLSIWANWQNQGNNLTPKKGNFITGGTLADGFDQQSQNASMFTYDETRRAFTPFSTANGKNTKFTPLKAGRAYYMFVYGDRTNSIFDTTPDSTVLSATGTLLTGDQRFNTTSSNPLSNVVDRFSLLGNPFVSPVDWSTISRTNLANTYWGWDPNLSSSGGYVTVSSTGTTTLISPFSGVTGLNQFIQPGQGFFVKTTAPFPVLTIREQDKTGNFNSNAFRAGGNATNNIPLLAINLLYDRSGLTVLADGALAAFDPAFAPAIGEEDATKLFGSGEWLGLSNAGQLLSIDGRPMPSVSDTLVINMAKLTKPSYTLQVFANQMDDKNVRPYLEDAYLKTSLALSVADTNLVSFSVDPSVAASSDINRFRITFRKTATARQEAVDHFPYIKMGLVKPLSTGPAMQVYPNPVVNQQINVHLVEIEKGNYTLVMQNSRGQQLSPLRVDHRGGTGSYMLLLKQRLPAGTYYLHLNYKKLRYSQVIVIE